VSLLQTIQEALKTYAVSSNGIKHCAKDELSKTIHVSVLALTFPQLCLLSLIS
jgi:hypothetical protein